MNVAGANVLVVGMAKSGVAAAELLAGHGAHVHATDSRPLTELGDTASALERIGAGFSLQTPALFEGRDLIVISPGVPADIPELVDARKRGIPVIGELELASWYLQGPSIGITGANGKTTTTALIGHILRECGIPRQVGGNIGTAPAAMVEDSRPEQWNVLELSSFQLETIDTFRAKIGIVTNITPDHLDRHHTMDAYVAAKGLLFQNQTEEDFAVLNADDPTCLAYAGTVQSRVLWFSLAKPVSPGLWLDRGKLLFDGEMLMDATDIPLRGRHNIENTMAAAAAARLAGAKLNDIAAAVRSFPGVEHRLEFVHCPGCGLL